MINARSFTTGNELRDRTIRSRILQSAEDRYEMITFTPTAIEGLEGAVSPGDTISFRLTGDLTVRDLTRPVTFEVTVDVATPDLLEGTATASVSRGDFELQIPSVPSVADVSEEILLELDFEVVGS